MDIKGWVEERYIAGARGSAVNDMSSILAGVEIEQSAKVPYGHIKERAKEHT